MPRGYARPALDDDSAAEPQQPQTFKNKPGAMPNLDSGVYKHAQYNSPIRLYSSECAKEQFIIQSGGKVDVTGVNQSTPENIKESEVYKMCQAADAKGYRPKKPRDPLLRHNSEDDEMRFSGLRTKADLPSKAFHRLNKMVCSDNLNTGSNQTINRGSDENNEEPEIIGNYNESEWSIRFRCYHIPSPSFPLLQTLAKEDDLRKQSGSPSSRTISDDEDDGMPDRLNEEDMVDKRYTGAHIPSKSFKALQMYMDDDQTGSEGDTGGPKIKVISPTKSPKVSPKPDRPVNSPVPQPKEAPYTDF